MKKIMIIEDEEDISLPLRDSLANAGFEVEQAKNGEDGLARALSSHPDLILLDLLMPKMDGLTMLNKLREDAWGKSVPVIVLSNLSQPATVAATIDTVNEYLVKVDWAIDDIVKKIKEKLKV